MALLVINLKEANNGALDLSNACEITLSANELRQFCECPRKRYYASRDCLAIRSNAYNKNLALGGVFHKMMQYYYTELNKRVVDKYGENAKLTKDDLEDLQDMMDFDIPVFEIPVKDDGTTLDAESLKEYNLMSEMYKEQIPQDLIDFEIVNCEQEFQLTNWPIGNVMYHGQIDMVVRKRSDGKIYFFEHKTCKNFRPEIYTRFDIQLHIYNEYGRETYKGEFGGMILNQIKKAVTEKGYGQCREEYVYSDAECEEFFIWILKKTEALVSPDNKHAPCNLFMTCKMCEYSTICLKYGYEIPKKKEDITETFKNEDGTPMYTYCPRDEEEEE